MMLYDIVPHSRKEMELFGDDSVDDKSISPSVKVARSTVVS